MDSLGQYAGSVENPFLLIGEVEHLDTPEAYVEDFPAKHTLVTHQINMCSSGHKVRLHQFEIEPLSKEGENVNIRTAIKGLGMSNIIFGFLDLYNHGKRMIQAKSRVDFEAQVEASIRLFSLPLGIVKAIENIILFFITLFEGITVLSLSLSALFLGSVFLFLELGLELYRLIMVSKLKKDLNGDEIRDLTSNLKIDPNLKPDEELVRIKAFILENGERLEKHLGKEGLTCLEDLIKSATSNLLGTLYNVKTKLQIARISLTERKIQKIYLESFELNNEDKRWISKTVEQNHERNVKEDQTEVQHYTSDLKGKYKKEILKGKGDRLARRIGHSMIGEIAKYRASYLSRTCKRHIDFDRIEKDSFNMFNLIEKQAKKAMLVHFIGVGAIAAGIACMIASYLLMPTLPLLAVCGATFALQGFRSLAPLSYLDHQGEKFIIKPWKDKVYEIISPEKKLVSCIEMTTFSYSGVERNKQNAAYSAECVM